MSPSGRMTLLHEKSSPLRGDFLAPNENRFLGPINSLRLKFKTQGNILSLMNNSRKNNENTDSFKKSKYLFACCLLSKRNVNLQPVKLQFAKKKKEKKQINK